MPAWVAGEWRALCREQQATAVLKRDYNATALAVIYSKELDRISDDQCIDIRELRRGRLFVPVESVSFYRAKVDRRAFQQLEAFRNLETLTFQDCRIDTGADFPGIGLGGLRQLDFWNTAVTTSQLRDIAHLSRLTYLQFDASGLKGDWLQDIAGIPTLQSLTVNNGDLCDGATESLARMKGLTDLQLSDVMSDLKLGRCARRTRKTGGFSPSSAPPLATKA